MVWDAVIVGSGFGGAMVAHRLVAAGARVLMIERGDWVTRGDAAWLPDASLELTTSYAKDIPYRCDRNGHGPIIGGYACVGGPSVYYGCVAFRFRERDFVGDADVIGGSGARWPFCYADIEPYYGEAESLLGIAGDDSADPTSPWRSTPYPFPPAELAPITQHFARHAQALGLSPFHLPLAINHTATTSRNACIACRTCDTYACAIEAKNDVATMLVAPLVRRGMALQTRTVATRLELDARADRIARLHVTDRDTNTHDTIEAHRFILAAGALGTPHLLLASDLSHPALGRYLMRHDNAMVFGFYPSRPDPDRRFHKQIAIHDYYFGDRDSDDAADLTKLGGIQQMMTPPKELVRAHLPRGTKTIIGALTEQLTGLLCIAEDQPRHDNGLGVDWDVRDVYGLPQLVIDHSYSERDRRSKMALVRRARRLLEATGALFSHVHHVKTFSHAVGTARMGVDPATSVLDGECRFRGLQNLWVTDGSALPMSSGVNPSLTIAANALRAADAIARSS